MGTPLRVLVVDDSASFRRILTVALERDPDIKVVATARDGAVALEQLSVGNPDIVTLDLEMPTLGGIATLREIRRQKPNLPVLVVSASTTRGARATMDALAAGASDYFTKPGAAEGVSIDGLSAELIRRVRILTESAARASRLVRTPATPRAAPRVQAPADAAGVERPQGTLAAAPLPTVPTAAARGAVSRMEGPRAFGNPTPRILIVGASTGGPEAITRLLLALPRPFSLPVLVVQHMPVYFTSVFAERLATTLGVDVREAIEGEVLRPGQIRLAPGDRHVEVRADRNALTTHLTQEPPENFCRPSVDVTLRTAAEACGARVLAVILTGVGADGRAGCARVTAAGGRVYAQDEATSVVWGMPGAVARAGLAERVGPIPDLAVAVQQALMRGDVR